MNLRLVWKQLSIIAMLIGTTMAFSLPWAVPAFGHATKFERSGFFGLLGSMAICFVVAGVLRYSGRKASGKLFRKEAMAVVGLSWILATVLGAMPYLFCGTSRSYDKETKTFQRMNLADALFESQSGFSTTGATVLTDVENQELIPRCILFWRSSTHFLGGLGIIVLFVAILGQGSAGKVLMRAEMPGPTKEGSEARMQHTSWIFASIYFGLNALLTLLLKIQGLPLFDSLCHAFGTMATGGFSTRNLSIGSYNNLSVELTILVFMIIAGTNFTLLYFLLLRKPGKMLADVEWRTYMSVIVGVIAMVVLFGFYLQQDSVFENFGSALRYGSFQVVSIMTTTGYGTHDFDQWNNFGRGILFLLMFVGGCAGSTGGGLKVIRHILFLKILRLEVEHAFHPSVVRPLRLAGKPVEDQDLRRNILVYFGLILVIFIFSWMFLVTIEPDKMWQNENKLIDSASCIAATLNNIGPGLGTIGPTSNYAHFSWPAKILFTWLMMIGRLEIFAILVLFMPSFWRSR